MIDYSIIKAAFIPDNEGSLNKVTLELFKELDIYHAIEAHCFEIRTSQEVQSCRLTLDDRYNFEIDVNNPIKDGADVLIKQCYISSGAAEKLIKFAFEENDKIAFGKVLH